MEKTGNFDSDIHSTDFMDFYRTRRAEASSLIQLGQREVQSLGGKWRCFYDQYQSNLRMHWYEKKADRSIPWDCDWDSWESIDVPSSIDGTYEGSVLYQRYFDYEKKDSRRLYLYFEGSSYSTVVFLNGQYLGIHDGGSTAFVFDITDVVQSRNNLLVDVDTRRQSYRVPACNMDWVSYGGLFRDVFLLSLPNVFIKDYFFYNNGGFGLDVSLSEALDLEGKLSIEALGYEKDIEFINGKAHCKLDIDPVLWSPDNPVLYNVRLSCLEDEVTDLIGFKDFRFSGRSLELNSRPFKIKGVSIHEFTPGDLRSVDDDFILRSIAQAKALGCNLIRLAHYPHKRAFDLYADKLGILLWQEIPVYWVLDFGNPVTQADAINQLQELILRDRNRVSAAIWAIGNENADTQERYDFMSTLARVSKSLDPSRPVGASCLVDRTSFKITDRLVQDIDIVGINEYMGWYDKDYEHLIAIFENSNCPRPVVITEFGASAKQGFIGKEGELFSEANQAFVLNRQLVIQKGIESLSGSIVWLLYDFPSPRRANAYQRGYNLKGLIASDQTTRKMAYEVVRKHFTS